MLGYDFTHFSGPGRVNYHYMRDSGYGLRFGDEGLGFRGSGVSGSRVYGLV